jgi:hypothetical protein
LSSPPRCACAVGWPPGGWVGLWGVLVVGGGGGGGEVTRI